MQQHEYGVYVSPGSFLYFCRCLCCAFKGPEGVFPAAGCEPVGLSVSCVFFSFLRMDIQVESPSGHKKGDYSVHPGAHGSVCMGDGVFVGEKGGQVAEAACLSVS